jgi:hypothetical protein
MRTARVRLPREPMERKFSALDILEIGAILFVFAALTLSARGQASQGVQPLNGNPLSISVSHDRTATPTAMGSEHSLLDSVDGPRVEHGERPLSDFAPTRPRFVPLGDIARAWRAGHGDPKLRIVWMPCDR